MGDVKAILPILIAGLNLLLTVLGVIKTLITFNIFSVANSLGSEIFCCLVATQNLRNILLFISTIATQAGGWLSSLVPLVGTAVSNLNASANISKTINC